MTPIIPFHEIGRLPLPGDNVAIATRRLEAGSLIEMDGEQFQLDVTILEGHRFAIRPISTGQELLSWELPFGVAIADIAPGNYVCNASMLDALGGRSLSFSLPQAPNFADRIQPHQVDAATFQPASALPAYTDDRTFLGYRRSGNRGVGVRNMILLLGTSSLTGSFVKALEERLAGLAQAYPHIDGIVAVAHTEGSTPNPNNREFTLRTLAGFLVHANVGAVLAVDYGTEPINNQVLEGYARDAGYELDQLPHHFMTLSGGFQANLERAEAVVRGWLETVNATPRTPESLGHLKIALQCGGSDAFSGISGNPLASWVAREIIRYGGAANLAETDELIGAEPYVLQKVRDLATAQKFLASIARFKERAAWHGHTVEGNPSGGNKFRGLYNIVLKSIGAAMKRHPETRLDYVIDYSELMQEPGYYFMDSPGNDLESIAGQVAAGCNLIYFVTGNGSITNFPFAPTIKIVTTTRRFNLLSRDMDVNAGAYLDGLSMDDLGAQTLDLTVAVASGQLSVGEAAGHAQVQLWRNWQQTDASHVESLRRLPEFSGQPLPAATQGSALDFEFVAQPVGGRLVTDQVGLILPTSLCSGQIAQMATHQLNRTLLQRSPTLSRFVTLVHTEGCGVSSGTSEELYTRTMLGYITHPLVRHCLLLEHGCEKTHNDFMRNQLQEMGQDLDQLGWASVQLDGGIQQVLAKIEDWFAMQAADDVASPVQKGGLANLRLGLTSDGPLNPVAATALGQLAASMARAGGTLVTLENASLLSDPAFVASALAVQTPHPTLGYAQPAGNPGFHVMETPTGHWVESLAGLGATGVELILAYAGRQPVQGHPMLPVVQVTADSQVWESFGPDLDLYLQGEPVTWAQQILDRLGQVIGHTYTPALALQGNIDFQITRGLAGISM